MEIDLARYLYLDLLRLQHKLFAVDSIITHNNTIHNTLFHNHFISGHSHDKSTFNCKNNPDHINSHNRSKSADKKLLLTFYSHAYLKSTLEVVLSFFRAITATSKVFLFYKVIT